MRLVTYDRGGARRLGAWVDGTVVDLPDAVGHPSFPTTMEALVEHNGYPGVRDKGLLRLEGKEYIVKDGDVLVIRHG